MSKALDPKNKQENNLEKISAQIEAIIFASPEALSIDNICKITELKEKKDLVQQTLDNLILFYKNKVRGFEFVKSEDECYSFRSKQQFSSLIEKIFEQKPRPLSRAAQETIAIIAYRQPITRTDIEFIRGVDAGSIIKKLLEKDLICCVGRKEDIGRPIMFGTTKEFLKIFNLNSIDDLPPLESFQPEKNKMQSAYEKISHIHKEQVDININQANSSLSE